MHYNSVDIYSILAHKEGEMAFLHSSVKQFWFYIWHIWTSSQRISWSVIIIFSKFGTLNYYSISTLNRRIPIIILCSQKLSSVLLYCEWVSMHMRLPWDRKQGKGKVIVQMIVCHIYRNSVCIHFRLIRLLSTPHSLILSWQKSWQLWCICICDAILIVVLFTSCFVSI